MFFWSFLLDFAGDTSGDSSVPPSNDFWVIGLF